MTSGVEPTSRSVGRARTRNLRSNSKSPYPGSLIPGVYLRDRPKGGTWAGPAARSAQVRRASLGSLLRIAVPVDLTADPDVVAVLGQRLVVHQAQAGVHDHVVDHHTAGVGVHPQGVTPVAGPEVAVRGRPVGADLHQVGVATDPAGALH